MLKSVVDEAKQIASTASQRSDLEIFRERAAAAQVAPNPMDGGEESARQMKQFIRENLE